MKKIDWHSLALTAAYALLFAACWYMATHPVGDTGWAGRDCYETAEFLGKEAIFNSHGCVMRDKP